MRRSKPPINMKVKKISRKLIKPQTPTPQNLKNYYISFLDQQQSAIYAGVVLFYQPYSKPENDVIQQLEESLAKILVQFYPLSGRYIKNDHMVDCSDQGAEFVEAEALDIELMELVAKTESAEQLKDLFPDQYFRDDAAPSNPLLVIQATRFPRRGLAISIGVSHRIFDVSSLGTFISMWSNACCNNGALIAPSFDLPSLLPYKDMSVVDKEGDYKNVLKRFVFNRVAITSMKWRAARGKQVSRVRVVCAVIAKALVRVDRAKHGRDREFHIHQPVNIRERTIIRPQPKHACGNFSFPSLTPQVAAAPTVGIKELVDLLGDAVSKSIADYVEILSPHRDGREIVANKLESLNKALENSETNFITFSDWSKFGFYEADFGLGKAIWTVPGIQGVDKNCTVLMSNKECDGIEAWVHLNQNDMRCFEHDHEIRFFANLATSKY